MNISLDLSLTRRRIPDYHNSPAPALPPPPDTPHPTAPHPYLPHTPPPPTPLSHEAVHHHDYYFLNPDAPLFKTQTFHEQSAYSRLPAKPRYAASTWRRFEAHSCTRGQTWPDPGICIITEQLSHNTHHTINTRLWARFWGARPILKGRQESKLPHTSEATNNTKIPHWIHACLDAPRNALHKQHESEETDSSTTCLLIEPH